jgi:hypothetical protein
MMILPFPNTTHCNLCCQYSPFKLTKRIEFLLVLPLLQKALSACIKSPKEAKIRAEPQPLQKS